MRRIVAGLLVQALWGCGPEDGVCDEVTPEAEAVAVGAMPCNPLDATPGSEPGVVEYLAQDERGNRILVVTPPVFDSAEAQLFYGPPEAVLQRPIAWFGRERDGGTTRIGFGACGQNATLLFRVGCNGPFTHDCEGELELPDETLTVSIPERDVAVPEGEVYLCSEG